MGLYYLMSPLFGIGGLIILGVAIARHRKVIKRRRRATAQADAVVVEELIRIDQIGTRSVPHYIYEFSAGGIRRRAQFAGRRGMQKGDVVSIFYDPDYPDIIYIPQFQSKIVIAALYFIGGAWTFGGIELLVLAILGIK